MINLKSEHQRQINTLNQQISLLNEKLAAEKASTDMLQADVTYYQKIIAQMQQQFSELQNPPCILPNNTSLIIEQEKSQKKLQEEIQNYQFILDNIQIDTLLEHVLEKANKKAAEAKKANQSLDDTKKNLLKEEINQMLSQAKQILS